MKTRLTTTLLLALSIALAAASEVEPNPSVLDYIGTGAGLLVAGVVFVLLLILAVVWLIFPFIVIRKCNAMITLLQRIDSRPEFPIKTSVEWYQETVRARQLLEKLHHDLAETNKALQWMIDDRAASALPT